MDTTITHDGVELLHKLLEFIEPNVAFDIGSLHAINIIKPQCAGEKDLAKYDKIRSEAVKSGIYDNITDWLIEQKFVDVLDRKTSPKKVVLQLNKFGEVLWGYGDVYKYFSSKRPLDEKDIITKIPSIIETAPPYGEFAFIVSAPKTGKITKIINTSSLSDGSELLKNLADAINPKQKIINSHIEWQIGQQVLEYLVNHGFAINRHDIEDDSNSYRQLTDKGRKLKECGSLIAYENYITEKEKKNKRKEELEDTLLENHVYLTSDQRKTDRKYRQYTLLIAVVGLVAAVAIPLLQSYLSDDYVSRHELRNEVRREIQLQAPEKAAQHPSTNADTSNVVGISSNKEGVNQKSSDSTAAIRKAGE